MARPQTSARAAATVLPHRHDMADLQSVMRLIDDRLDDIVAAIPERKRPLVANALLNLAIERLLTAEGPAAAASILRRLAEFD